MDAESSLLPGDPATIGSYRIIGRLGSGGMGVVYLALSPGGRRVALKVVRRELAEDAGFRQRFENEVRAATQVHSAYTAAVIDADPGAAQPWLATSYVNGPSLSRYIEDRGRLDAAEVWALGAGLAEALTAIHDSGIVHRDLKPSNVLLADDGPRVIDFGIARAAQAASITQTGLMVGSPAYMAPEYVGGNGAGPAADVFALGGTVLFAATGAPPFGEGPAEAVMMRLLHEQPRLEGVDDRLSRVLRRVLDKNPDKRPDARSLITVFADGAEERGATMSFPRRPGGSRVEVGAGDGGAPNAPRSGPPTSPPPSPPPGVRPANSPSYHPQQTYQPSGFEQQSYGRQDPSRQQDRRQRQDYGRQQEYGRQQDVDPQQDYGRRQDYGQPDVGHQDHRQQDYRQQDSGQRSGADLAYRRTSEPSAPSTVQTAATVVLLALLCLLVGVAAFLVTRAL